MLKTWAVAFPDPRQEAEISMEVLLAASSSARFAGFYSFRKLGYVLQSARVLGSEGYSIAVTQDGQGMSRCGTSDAQVASGDVLRKFLVPMETEIEFDEADLSDEEIDAPWGAWVSAGHGARPKARWAREAQMRGRGVAEQLLKGTATMSAPRCWRRSS